MDDSLSLSQLGSHRRMGNSLRLRYARPEHLILDRLLLLRELEGR